MFAEFASPTEIIIVLVVILVLFGGAQLPKLAKNLGKAQKEFKEGLADGMKSNETKAGDTKAAEKTSDESKS